MNYYGLDPLNMHDCGHCQHHAYDLDNGHICLLGEIAGRMILNQVNDCGKWLTPYESDYYRRYDLEKQLEKELKKIEKDKQLKLQL